MFGRKTPPAAPAIRTRGHPFPGRARVSALALILAWGMPSAWALDPSPGSEAVENLAKLVAPAEPPRGNDWAPRLYRTVYWLSVATRSGLDPDNALTLAGQSVRRELSGPCRSQLLTDWRVAGSYGLLTPENLERMQEGLAPKASDGPYTGQRIEGVRLRGYAIMAPDNLACVAFSPVGRPPPPEALGSGAVALPAAAYAVSPVPSVQPWRSPATGTFGQPTPFRGGPYPQNTKLPAFYPSAAHRPVYPPAPAPAAPVAVEPPAIRPEQVELHDVPFNGSLPLGGTRKLAVASDSGDELSVSVIGDGPKVRIDYENVGTVYYPRVNNSKAPKANPVHLPGVSGNAYLIHTEATARYYFVDVTVNNGGSFRIAKVVASR